MLQVKIFRSIYIIRHPINIFKFWLTSLHSHRTTFKLSFIRLPFDKIRFSKSHIRFKPRESLILSISFYSLRKQEIRIMRSCASPKPTILGYREVYCFFKMLLLIRLETRNGFPSDGDDQLLDYIVSILSEINSIVAGVWLRALNTLEDVTQDVWTNVPVECNRDAHVDDVLKLHIIIIKISYFYFLQKQNISHGLMRGIDFDYFDDLLR